VIPVAVRRSRIHGQGVFTMHPVPGRCKLGEVSGVLVRTRSALREQRQRALIFLVELDDGWALDCTNGNAFRHLNHACAATCYLRVFRQRVEVYSRGAIAVGNELTVDYRITQHPGGMLCACGQARCRGRL
jgi:hypothetical protein